MLTIFLRPTKAPAKPDPSPNPYPNPKGRPREAAFDPFAVATAALAGLALTSCQAKEEAKPADPGKSAPAEITVTASDTACELSGTEGATGPSTFVITNNGTKVTEFYVYGEGERVMGEVENISPGLQRKLIVQLGEPGTYQTACKPGMVGDGIRGDFKVTGDSVKIDEAGKFKEASESYKRYVNSQTDALIAATQIFVDAVKKGDVNAAKAQFPIARTYYERIEPVAESFPNDLDPRIDLREADLEPGQKWTGFHRLEKDLWVTGLQPDSNAMADQLMADVKELDARREGPRRARSTRPRSPVAHRVCSTRSRRARSPAKRTPSATPTCGTSRPTSTARRRRWRRCGRSSTSATPTSARRWTSGSPKSTRCSRSTARATVSCSTTR